MMFLSYYRNRMKLLTHPHMIQLQRHDAVISNMSTATGSNITNRSYLMTFDNHRSITDFVSNSNSYRNNNVTTSTYRHLRNRPTIRIKNKEEYDDNNNIHQDITKTLNENDVFNMEFVQNFMSNSHYQNNARSDYAMKRWLENFERLRLFVNDYRQQQQRQQQQDQKPEDQNQDKPEYENQKRDIFDLESVKLNRNSIPLPNDKLLVQWLERQRYQLRNWILSNGISKEKKDNNNNESQQPSTTKTTTTSVIDDYDNNDQIMDMKINLLQSIGYTIMPRDVYWEERYKQLCQYIKDNNGLFPYHTYNHDNDNDRKLFFWCRQQKAYYKEFILNNTNSKQKQHQNMNNINNNSAIMTLERINKLESIGFTWNQNDEKWHTMYQQLKSYMIHHGDCIVPKNYSINKSLAKWVETQRTEYDKYQKQQKNKKQQPDMILETNNNNNKKKDYYITNERIQLLNELNFAWDPLEVKWHMKYNELYHYIHHIGSLNVGTIPSKKGNISLRRWIIYQIQLYDKQKENNNNNNNESNSKIIKQQINSLTPHRIALLNKLGFLLS